MNRRERRQFEAELRALARGGVEVSELGRLKEGWTCNCSALRARRRDAASLQRHRAREWQHGGERRHRDPGETTALNRTVARTPARERPPFRFVFKSDSSTGVKDDVCL
jgi:hypothetical protein